MLPVYLAVVLEYLAAEVVCFYQFVLNFKISILFEADFFDKMGLGKNVYNWGSLHTQIKRFEAFNLWHLGRILQILVILGFECGLNSCNFTKLRRSIQHIFHLPSSSLNCLGLICGFGF